MKRKQIELDVDFIGGERPLSEEDEKAFSEYLKTNKLFRRSKSPRKSNIRSRKKINT